MASYSLLTRGMVSIHCLTEHITGRRELCRSNRQILPLIYQLVRPAPSQSRKWSNCPDSAAVPFESGNLAADASGKRSYAAQISLGACFDSCRVYLAASVDPRRPGTFHASGLSRTDRWAAGRACLHGSAPLGILWTPTDRISLRGLKMHRSFADQYGDVKNCTVSRQCTSGGCFGIWSGTGSQESIGRISSRAGQRASYLPRLIAAETSAMWNGFSMIGSIATVACLTFASCRPFREKNVDRRLHGHRHGGKLGRCGKAECQSTVRFDGGESANGLEVRWQEKGVIRMEVPAAPREVVVNDSSVPESDTTNDTLKIQADDSK